MLREREEHTCNENGAILYKIMMGLWQRRRQREREIIRNSLGVRAVARERRQSCQHSGAHDVQRRASHTHTGRKERGARGGGKGRVPDSKRFWLERGVGGGRKWERYRTSVGQLDSRNSPIIWPFAGNVRQIYKCAAPPAQPSHSLTLSTHHMSNAAARAEFNARPTAPAHSI